MILCQFPPMGVYETLFKFADPCNPTGVATKGLQVPGMRIGWAIASKEYIEIFRNYSSFGMGGVSRASQIVVTKLDEDMRILRESLR